MKRIVALILAVLTVLMLTASCGKNQDNAVNNTSAEKKPVTERKENVLYRDIDFSEYIELGQYDGVSIDTSSQEFLDLYDGIIDEDVRINQFFVRKTEGTVAKGDTVNIDYVGKIDGKAFDGGSDKNFDLKIGSNTFSIDGFESSLVGVEIGKTAKLELKFPDNYIPSTYAGKSAVFTVKVNYVKTTQSMPPEEYYSELNFKTVDDYTEDVKERAAKEYLYDKLLNDSKVLAYPEDDLEFLTEKCLESFKIMLQSQYGMTMEDYLKQEEKAEIQFREELAEVQVKPMIETNMCLYALLQNEEIKITNKDIAAEIKKAINEQGDTDITDEAMLSYYGEYYFEIFAAKTLAIEYMYKKADIF